MIFLLQNTHPLLITVVFLNQLVTVLGQDFLKFLSMKWYSEVIRAVTTNKVHGYDDISIRMITLCEQSIVIPLSPIFDICIRSSIFPDIWKKWNIIPVCKEGHRQLLHNYRPVSLLPILR